MPLNESYIRYLVEETLSKKEVKDLIDDKLKDYVKDKEFEKRVKELAGEIIANLGRYIYNQRGFIKGGL